MLIITEYALENKPPNTNQKVGIICELKLYVFKLSVFYHFENAVSTDLFGDFFYQERRKQTANVLFLALWRPKQINKLAKSHVVNCY